MSDYKPLEIERIYNAGATFFDTDRQPKIGDQVFHGLPFKIGADANRCFVGFAGGAGAVSIPINDMAYNIIFAHTLLESQVLKGEPIGRMIAHYVVQYADGTTERVPIRERFEIGVVPTAWGQWPFVAVPEQKDFLAGRTEGRWEQTGWRQTEAGYAHRNDYYLWAWRNPRPESVIEKLTIEPGNPSPENGFQQSAVSSQLSAIS